MLLFDRDIIRVNTELKRVLSLSDIEKNRLSDKENSEMTGNIPKIVYPDGKTNMIAKKISERLIR